MLRFFYSPHSCSLGIRVILEEAGADYGTTLVDVRSRQQFASEYQSVNPKRKIPALIRDDGSLLTEFQTIAFWLGMAYPDAKLLPRDDEGRIRVMEALDFMIGSVHMRGFTFVIVPGKFSSSPAAQEDLVKHGMEQIELGFARLSEMLGDKDWLLGDYSIADAALFYLTNWAVGRSIAMPRTLVAFHNRMLDRPAVQRALQGEGLQPMAA